MRRILILCSVLVLLVCCAVPAFAIGESGTDETVYFPFLSFDVMRFDTGSLVYSLPYPFNSAMQGGTSSFDYFDGSVWGTQTANYDADGVLRLYAKLGMMMGSGGFSMSMSGGNTIIDYNDVAGEYTIGFDPSDLQVDTVTLSCSYYVITRSGVSGNYFASKRSAIANVTPTSAGYISISELFRQIYEQAGSTELFLDNYHVYITGHNLSVNTDYLNFWVGCSNLSSVDSPVSFDDWFRNQRLSYQVTEVSQEFDIFEWLTQSIETFLQFEILPEFSIDKLFVIVLVVGLMLWFVKLLT